MRCLVMFACVALAAVAAPASAQDREVEISFYFQPDSSGENTLNTSVEIDGDEITIEESRNDGANRYVERDATADEIALIEEFVRARIAAIDLTEAERPDQPRVEIQFEFDAGARTIEVEEIYPAGAVPEDYIALQERFFEGVFR